MLHIVALYQNHHALETRQFHLTWKKVVYAHHLTIQHRRLTTISEDWKCKSSGRLVEESVVVSNGTTPASPQKGHQHRTLFVRKSPIIRSQFFATLRVLNQGFVSLFKFKFFFIYNEAFFTGFES